MTRVKVNDKVTYRAICVTFSAVASKRLIYLSIHIDNYNLENIDIGKDILENINIIIDIDKDILGKKIDFSADL